MNANGVPISNPLSRSAEQLCERLAQENHPVVVPCKSKLGSMTLTRKSHKGGTGGGGTWGSISRVFARQKKRPTVDASAFDGKMIGDFFNKKLIFVHSNEDNVHYKTEDILL